MLGYDLKSEPHRLQFQTFVRRKPCFALFGVPTELFIGKHLLNFLNNTNLRELADRTINSELYCRQLKRTAKKLRESGRQEPVVFLHDNARPHTSKMTTAKLAELDWDVLPHAPYSPDKAPSDFHLFRSLKNWLKGRKFNSTNDVRIGIQEFFDSKNAEFYARGIDGLVDRWEHIIAFDGDYCD